MLKRLLAAAAIALAATPALADEVNVYTTRQPYLIQPIFDDFTKETGIKVNVLYAASGLIERLKAEGDRSPADLFLTADISNLQAAADAGLVQQHHSKTVDTVVPEALRDPKGEWFALTTRARVVFAAKGRVDPTQIKTYDDLADPKWKGRICIRPGVHSYNLGLFAAVIAHEGLDKAHAWVEGLKANLARTPQGNDTAEIKAVWAGECDIAIANTYYLGKILDDPDSRDWGEAVNVIFPKFEGGGTHVNISGAAITKSSPNPEATRKLIDFMLSEEAQKLYAQLNFEYPVREGVALSDVVASWGKLTPDNIPLTQIGELRSEALKLVDETGFDN
jgi:iron(III) transport system substrate-binding protein